MIQVVLINHLAAVAAAGRHEKLKMVERSGAGLQPATKPESQNVSASEDKTQQKIIKYEVIPRANRRGHPRLAIEDAEVIRLRDGKNYSWGQIGATLGCCPNTAWNRYHIAKNGQ